MGYRFNPFSNTLDFFKDSAVDIGGAVGGGTDKSVLFVNPAGILDEDTLFTYDKATGNLKVPLLVDSTDVLTIDPNLRLAYGIDGTTVNMDWSKSTYTLGVYLNTLQTDTIFPAVNSSVAFGSGGDADVYLRDIYFNSFGGHFYDAVNAPTIDNLDRTLNDSLGNVVLRWHDTNNVGELFGGSGNYSINLGNGTFTDMFSNCVQFYDRKLVATLVYGLSLDWEARIAYAVDGTTGLIDYSGTASGSTSQSFDSSGNCFFILGLDVMSGTFVVNSSSEVGFFSATPVVQQTTAITGATVSNGTGSNVKDDDTFDGYTVAQVVAALRAYGILA
jgi:hypothetical protein